MSTSTASERAVKRVHNFNAGPGALPLPVLQRIKEELLDWRGSGMSVMEMSHRSPEFESINAAAEAGLRKHLAIPDDYAVLFLQGGGSMQFTMAPMNLCLPGKPVDLIHTGTWTAKALGELKKGILHNVAASTEADKFARLPRKDEIKYSPDASYVHMCTNNTIEGTQWTEMPETGSVPLVADMSSDIASRPIDVKKFGLIFAGAQKNLGPSGVTVVIVRKDLAERADKNLPTILQYRTFIKEKSLYQHAADVRDLHRRAGDGMDRCRRRHHRDRKAQQHQGEAALRHDRGEQRLLPLPGRKFFAVEDECGVSRCWRE